jgi:hypothetical protein
VTASNRPSPTLSDVITDFRDDAAAEDQDASLRSSNNVLIGSMCGLVTLVSAGFVYQFRKHQLGP